MIAAGATPQEAQQAVEMVYLEEEQRLAAEQRVSIGYKAEGRRAKGKPRLVSSVAMHHGRPKSRSLCSGNR